jgi:CxxC-x17-CxxC domain-containing protein
MIKGKAPQKPDGGSAPSGSVRLEKRAAQPAPAEAEAVREKACSRCGQMFRVDADKKFHLCPDCYRKSVTYKKRGGAETRVMILVTCSACGKSEYLSFVPEDRDKALCRDCFAKAKPEPNPRTDHSRKS